MSQQLFPDILTGQPSPAGTGLNLYRCGSIVFSGTLSEASLDRVLAFLESPKCEPGPSLTIDPMEFTHYRATVACEHCWCKTKAHCGPHTVAVCCHCGESKPT